MEEHANLSGTPTSLTDSTYNGKGEHTSKRRRLAASYKLPEDDIRR